ncbi:hypothetical protein G7054_g5461 [Neopestalotiopsis clavispora]|nr:hypothetical protein G7054_g5461 [Neopestalotiopsis clavispora]
MTSSQENFVQNEAAGPFYDSLPAKNVEPLWLKFEAMVPPRPNPSAQSSIWRYEDIKPLLLDAGRIVPIEEAERRVLMLINPSIQAPCTTDTIYAGLQLIQPGETAPAHRHVAFALRMVIEGSGGYTAVEGEKIMMERGDVILTPSWTWHDHGNEGKEPVIWLDGLDLPIFKLLKVNFAEPYTKPQYPSEVSRTSLSKYPWKPVAKALNASGGPYAIYQYHSRNGDHLSKTLSAQAERISAGSTSPQTRETTSFVYHIMEGRGYSIIQESENKEPRRIDWSAKDTFAVPAWSRLQHTCTQNEGNAYLFAIHDRPVLEATALWRGDNTLD